MLRVLNSIAVPNPTYRIWDVALLSIPSWALAVTLHVLPLAFPEDNLNKLVKAAGGKIDPFFPALFAKICDKKDQTHIQPSKTIGNPQAGVVARAIYWVPRSPSDKVTKHAALKKFTKLSSYAPSVASIRSNASAIAGRIGTKVHGKVHVQWHDEIVSAQSNL